jgi:hypothetical protein
VSSLDLWQGSGFSTIRDTILEGKYPRMCPSRVKTGNAYAFNDYDYTTHSLLDWFLSQNDSAPGYAKAIFSGLPTSELAAVIRDVVVPREALAGIYHVSAAPICKLDLLHLIARQAWSSRAQGEGNEHRSFQSIHER